MKQSYGLIILQIIGIIVGLFSILWVAGSFPSEVYAIVGVQVVISSILVVFSNTGLGAHAIRKILLWTEVNDLVKIKKIIALAIGFRVLFATIVVLPMIGYTRVQHAATKMMSSL
jgi:hypothetical protein